MAADLASARRYGPFELIEHDWFPQLRLRLAAYAKGEPVDFADCTVRWPYRTEFQQRVIAATRRIRYGTTITYAALAAQAGSPRAARAVGNIMAANTVPIIIPCHRVVAAGGKLGGFSAPQGVRLKERMLALEAGRSPSIRAAHSGERGA